MDPEPESIPNVTPVIDVDEDGQGVVDGGVEHSTSLHSPTNSNVSDDSVVKQRPPQEEHDSLWYEQASARMVHVVEDWDLYLQDRVETSNGGWTRL